MKNDDGFIFEYAAGQTCSDLDFVCQKQLDVWMIKIISDLKMFVGAPAWCEDLKQGETCSLTPSKVKKKKRIT